MAKDGRMKNSGKGKRKIEIERIVNKSQKTVAFSKRRMGLFAKVHQYHQLTRDNIAAIAFSPAGHLYTSDDNGCSVDAIFDEYLELDSKRKDIVVSSNIMYDQNENDNDKEARKLMEWILDTMVGGEINNENNIESLLAIKAKLEGIKEEVDNRLT